MTEQRMRFPAIYTQKLPWLNIITISSHPLKSKQQTKVNSINKQGLEGRE